MRSVLGAALRLLPSSALAETPNVVTDIAPVHSLVSAVMEGVGTPDILIPAGASAHDYAFRPSSARQIQQADLIFWIGAGLTLWLEQPLESLAQAPIHELASVEGVTEREVEEHGHDHGHLEAHSVDPHFWLDPQNASLWLSYIAIQFAEIDPQNAALYAQNAQSEIERLKAVYNEVLQNLRSLEPKYVVLHDAVGYFEARFGIAHIGAVSEVSDAALTPVRMREIQDRVSGLEVDCVIAEPGFDPDLVPVVLGERDVSVTVVDPLGSAHKPGPDLYRQLIGEIAAALIDRAG